MADEDESIPNPAPPEPDRPTKTPTDIFNIIFYVSIFLLIGFPLWWTTTTTHRVALPFDRIEAFEGGSRRKTHDASVNNVESSVMVLDASQKWRAFWVLPPTTTVDIVITLVNPSPDKMRVDWNPEAIQQFLEPTLSRLREIATFKVSTQVLRYVDGELNGITFSDSKHKISLLDASKVINLVEGRLGTFSSNNHLLNFVLFVPPPQHQPLIIVEPNGRNIPTNALITPRWGGVMIYPGVGNSSVGSEIVHVTIHMKNLAEVFLTQLLTHFGMIDVDERDLHLDFEKDLENLIRKRIGMNVDDSISTLKSLASLLGQMGQIAINERVGQNIYDAVGAIEATKASLLNGNNLEALAHSRIGWEKAERAFYDPSLLEQLYFPDDQKFAIYVPLFLPVGLPVIMSIREAVKWWKSHRIPQQIPN